MSATGLDVLDKSIQTTNIWLDDIMDDIGPDRHVAWKVMSVVLHKLRDRMPVSLAAHLSAQLPLVVRGAYYDQYEPEKQPADYDCEEFIAKVADWLTDTRPVNPRLAVQSVLATLSRHIDAGQIAKVKDAMPKDLRAYWDSAEQAMARQPEAAL